MTEKTPDRRTAAFALLLGLTTFALLVWRFNFVGDDAYISFRYARHLARGHGLRYNLGVEPPVEGYSEFAWVLLMAASFKLGLSLELASRLLSVPCGVALVLWTLAFANRRLAHGPAARLGTALFLGSLPPLAVWTTGGMGTIAFALAVFATYERLLGEAARQRAAAAALGGVALVLLRADGAWWVALITTAGFAIGLREGSARLRRASIVAALVPAIVFGLHLAWRYSYHGDLLPNTARVKVGLSLFSLERGGRYVLHSLLTFPALLLALGLPLALGRRCLDRTTVSSLVIVAGTLLYALLAGGDFMCYSRFLVPALPFLALVLARGLALLEQGRGPLLPAVLAGAAALTSLLPAYDRAAVPVSVRRLAHFRFNDEEFRSEFSQWEYMLANVRRWGWLGLALRRYTHPSASVVVGGIGAVGYLSNRFIHDQNGLVDREVARAEATAERRSPGHDKVVPRRFFLDRAPTFIDVFLWEQGVALPDDVKPEVDRIVPLRPEDGFPKGLLFVGVRPRSGPGAPR